MGMGLPDSILRSAGRSARKQEQFAPLVATETRAAAIAR